MTQDRQEDGTAGTDGTGGSSLGQGHGRSSTGVGMKPLCHLTLSQAWLWGCAICQGQMTSQGMSLTEVRVQDVISCAKTSALRGRGPADGICIAAWIDGHLDGWMGISLLGRSHARSTHRLWAASGQICLAAGS